MADTQCSPSPRRLPWTVWPTLSTPPGLQENLKVGNITGNVHIEYRREDPGTGVAAMVLHCAVAVFTIVAPLNTLGGGLSIWVKSIKLSEGVLHKKRQFLSFPLVEEN